MAELDLNVHSNFSTDEEGNRRLSITRKYDVNDSTEEVDAAGNKVQVSHAKDVTKIVASDVASEYNTIVTEDFIDIGNFDVGPVNKVSYASEEKKAALLDDLKNSKNEGELAIAVQAVTDSYNSTTDNIGKSGYEEAVRVAAAKKQSFLAGANDETQVGNVTNVNGNAYDVRDADSRGDNRTVDVENGNANRDNSGSIHDDSVSTNAGQGDKGFTDGEGEGHAGQGTGTGMGNGTGSGVGDGNDGQVATSVKGGYNSNGTPIETTPVSQTNNSNDAEAIASYLSMINDDVPINHIFHNSFYQNDPVAHWSFTIDFIPSVQLQNNNINLYECGQRLTKAVIAASVPDRNVKSTVSHYKGMTIELPARAKTAGTLQMKFAETETFPISTILNQLYQFARSDTYFERIDNIISTLQNEEQIARYTQLLRAYRQAIPDGGHLYNILVKMYKMKDVQAFGEDNEVQPSFVYFFVGCDLQTVNQIEFNYDNDKPIDVSCVWTYQYFEELSFDEYKQRYGAGAQLVSTDYEPNGNVEAGALEMEGNPRAHQEAVEYMYRQDINKADLAMNEQYLENPYLFELEAEEEGVF